jgi:hypothetical protein
VENYLTSKHGSARPTTNAKLVHSFQSCKAIAGIDTGLASLVELIGEDVQHELTIALCVDVSVGDLIKALSESWGVDEVAVVGHADTVRAVNIKRLSFRVGTAAGGGVAKVAKAHVARQICNTSAVLEDLGGHTVALALVEAATRAAAHDTRGILTTVL